MKLEDEAEKYLMNTYARQAVAFVRGRGMRLWDTEDREYLDFLAGIAVVNLGHAHPGVARAIAEQASLLVHTSNLYQVPPQLELAKKLAGLSFADRAFFCNSGTEANEAALKLARRWAHENRGGAFEIIACEGGFHGRTMFSLSVTGQSKFHQGFEPLVPGVKLMPYDDLAAARGLVDDKTAAIIVEPIQGEGGVRLPGPGYLSGLRELCDREGVLLIFDEVQTGMGRTGRLFAYEHEGVEPDIMTLAKALGNGFPIGAVLATERAAAGFAPGAHGATFGGNFLAAQAALAVLREFEDGKLLAHVREIGDYFKDRLRNLAQTHDLVLDVRGRGLLLGMELDRPGATAVKHCFEKGFLVNCTAERILRFAPPLIVQKPEIEALLPVLDSALAELARA